MNLLKLIYLLSFSLVVIHCYNPTGTAKTSPVVFHIEIGEEEMKYFDASREEAKKMKLLQESGKKYKNATLTFLGKLYQIKLKLKGDLEDHWGGSKWSMRIKVPKGESLLGLTAFSLQAPRTREYLNEWVFHRMLKEEGVMSLDYRFVTVHLNGVNMKCYAMEQHFADDVFSTNNVDQSVVFRFNEDEWTPVMLASVGPERSREIYKQAAIETHNTKKVLNDPIRKAQFKAGKKLLSQWREGKKSATEVFDVQKMARFWAVSNLLNAGHAICWNNRRFSYNASTKKLEPIGYDANPSGNVRNLFCEERRLDMNSIGYFSDKEFTKAFLAELSRIATKPYLDEFFEVNQDSINVMVPMIQTNYKEYEFDKEIIYSNQKKIQELLQEFGTQ